MRMREIVERNGYKQSREPLDRDFQAMIGGAMPKSGPVADFLSSI